MTKRPVSVTYRGGRSLPWLPHVAGRYYTTPIASSASNTVTPAIDLLYAIPFIVPDTHTYDRISVECTTQDAAEPNDARLGIYRDNGAGAPSALVLDAGEIDLAGTGAKEITISQSLTPGWYWLAFVTESGVAILRGFSAAGAQSWLGSTTVTDGSTSYTYWKVAFTYAALPDPFTGGGALSGATIAGVADNTGNIKIMLRA